MEKELMIQEIVDYPGLQVQKTKHLTFEKTLPKPTYICKDPNALLGIEVEVENMRLGVPLEYYWKAKPDHSLRNFGVEYVSIPLRGIQVEHALRYLQQQMAISGNEPEFSPRTSIHVHLNVRDRTWGQVKTLVLLYALFEKHFFHLAGTRREQSIFCVPLYKSTQLQSIKYLEDGHYKWHKYNALNLATIQGDDDVGCYGTVEFRHLYGTQDLDTLMTWINNIMLLRKASFKYIYNDLCDKIRTLNTTSEYWALYEDIFQEYADIRMMSKHDFEYCVTSVKEALWGFELMYKEPFEATSNLSLSVLNKQPKAKTPWVVKPKPKSIHHDHWMNIPAQTIIDDIMDGA